MNNEWIGLPDLQAVAKAQADGWEIEDFSSSDWSEWNHKWWQEGRKYRARPAQPKMKKVKMLCWFDGAFLHWIREGYENHAMQCRIPAEDKEIEIPEDGK